MILGARRRAIRAPLRYVVERLLGPVTHVATSEPAVALTFDDGPDPRWTPRVLEVLERHRARATFFMLGAAAAAHPGLVRRVADLGHAIGNHSWDHRAFPKISSAARRRQIEACEAVLAPFGARLLRPPYGALSPAVVIGARRLRYEVVKWNVDVGDWWRDDPQGMTQDLVRRMRPGSIVVLHDVLTDHGKVDEVPASRYRAHPDRTAMLAALDAFLGQSTDRLRCVTVPELLRMGRRCRRR
jgi:peptidoglycan/xylan/chitin deacetylase (PgdA/CDA1 family)